MVIDLSKPEDLPAEFVDKLEAVSPRVWASGFSESVVKHRDVSPIVIEIHEFCLAYKVLGIHYTRANPISIREHGLLIRTGEEIRASFLSEHGHHFSPTEIDNIKTAWNQCFDPRQVAARDGRLWFNFTKMALSDGDASPLLEMYGGEQVGMCFRRDYIIGRKLASIGEPLVVSCALTPSDVNTYIQDPWGQILVSAFHKQQNPEAYCIDQDGSQRAPVLPENVLCVEALTKCS